MVEPIEPTTVAKKKRVFFAPYIPRVEPMIIWSGAIVPHHFVKLIFDSVSKVSVTSLKKTREVRQDHDRERDRGHVHRILKEIDMRRKDLKRDFVIIPSA